MTESKLKNCIGIFTMMSHFCIILLVIFLWIMKGFTFEEMTTAIALISPMFSLYTTAIIKHIISTKEIIKIKGRKLSNIYIFISFFLPVLFVSILASIICLKSFNIISNFEQFKIMLAVTQSAFGAYTALILSSLFEIKQNKNFSEAQSYKTPIQ